MPNLTNTPAVAAPVWYIGVDPGLSGGLAAVHADGSAEATAMPGDYRAAWEWVSKWYTRDVRHAVACIELVSGWVRGHNRRGRKEDDDGTQSNPGSAMFKFGKSAGALEMALVAAGLPYELVRPQAWQAALGVMCGGDVDGTTRKSYLRDRAQEMFPHVKVTKKTADALLIAEYCRRKWL